MRRKEPVTVPAWGGRDAGKVFMIEEWPAARAERWAYEALIAYNRGGGELPVERVMGFGMEGIFALGIQTFLRGTMKSEEVIPILDELMECVKIVRDPRRPSKETGEPVVSELVSPDDVEEVRVRAWLKSEVIRIHTGFSPAAALSNLISGIMASAPQTSQIGETSQPA